jgi:hypothetical protein
VDRPRNLGAFAQKGLGLDSQSLTRSETDYGFEFPAVLAPLGEVETHSVLPAAAPGHESRNCAAGNLATLDRFRLLRRH